MIDIANVPAGRGRRRSKFAPGEQEFTNSGILSSFNGLFNGFSMIFE